MTSHAARRTSRGLPFWVLPALLPLALSLGFVSGMGLAHYRSLPPQSPAPAAPVQAGEPAPSTGPTSWELVTPLETAMLNPAHLHPSEPTTGAPKTEEPVVDLVPLTPATSSGPTVSPLDPGQVYTVVRPSLPRAASIGAARLALQSDPAHIALIPGLEYQQMRNADGSISLVGMLTVEQYLTWEATLRRDPAALKRWLQSAAEIALSPAQADRFALSWALVETRPSPPSWALPSEVTALADGQFLVVRYLASATGPDLLSVTVREADSLGSPANPEATWSRFGPQIRFDGTDIYRPTGTDGTTKKRD